MIEKGLFATQSRPIRDRVHLILNPLQPNPCFEASPLLSFLSFAFYDLLKGRAQMRGKTIDYL